jgi:CRP-like cAMP-binding protein
MGGSREENAMPRQAASESFAAASSGRLTVDPSGSLAASLILKLEARDDLSDEERRVVSSIIEEPSLVGAREDLVREGDRPTSSTLVIEGFAGRYKVLENGSRQITAVHGPGDFIDLHSFLLKKMDHGVVTLTSCRLAKASHEALKKVTETHPHLARMFSLMTLIDGAIHREWLVSMGRRGALGHIAHLLCEIYKQLEIVNLAHDGRFIFPVTQSDLADMLGLSTVHVNRVLQELRAKQLIEWQGPKVRILDWAGLTATAEFDGVYLNLFKEPR